MQTFFTAQQLRLIVVLCCCVQVNSDRKEARIDARNGVRPHD